ncbi:hypothetical protein L0337_21450 [candidate division KSB1 bacterium]|nr:hypothetical protein [candidate division KSB1 bacterium]
MQKTANDAASIHNATREPFIDARRFDVQKVSGKSELYCSVVAVEALVFKIILVEACTPLSRSNTLSRQAFQANSFGLAFLILVCYQ